MGYTDHSPFDWDDENVDHAQRHDVEWWEAEEALADPKRVPLAPAPNNREVRRAFVGMTEAGRLLVVVYTHRGDRIRVVTARRPSDHEARLYRRGKGRK